MGLRVISDALVTGRWEEAREPTEKELRATSVVAVDIEHATAKIRTGGANDDEEATIDRVGNTWMAPGGRPLLFHPRLDNTNREQVHGTRFQTRISFLDFVHPDEEHFRQSWDQDLN